MGWVTALGEQLFRIRYRLLLVNALVVAVPVVGISFARFIEREMLRGLEQDMIHQAQLLRQALLADPRGPRLARRSRMLARAAWDTGTRIRLLDERGRVRADSGGSRDLVAGRAEVRRALRGDYGAATRLRDGGRRLELYSALPVERNGRVIGAIYVSRSTQQVKAAMYRLRRVLFRILVGSLAVTAVLSLFLAATISRPLSRLTRTARAIAAGDTSQTLTLNRRDEIGDLARAIDAMKDRLADRARYVAELSADICHEFKSPLTSIRGAAELLADGADDDPPARATFLRNITADAERLDRLVLRLLELARVEADPAPATRVDYRALIDEVIEGRDDIELHYRARQQLLNGRRAQLGSALTNLLDNAWQHAEPGTAVVIDVRSEAGFLITEVSNQGAELSPERMRSIWRRFFTTRTSEGGTGLGLAIVHSVVIAHGGEASVRCSGGVTTFCMTLPG